MNKTQIYPLALPAPTRRPISCETVLFKSSTVFVFSFNDGTVEEITNSKHALNSWWIEAAQLPAVPLSAVQDVPENSIVSVAGILGLITAEVKNVGSEMKTLTSLCLADTSGNLTVRSWNHDPDQFAFSIEKPIMLRRIRITSFAGQKVGELLDGSGTIMCSAFPGAAELLRFWAE